MQEPLTDSIITKYNNAALICGKVYNELKNNIMNGENNIESICKYGNERILEELSKIYKKEIDKNIAFPVTISTNNYLGNSNALNLKEDDVIKIELGVSISGYISILAETFTKIENKKISLINKFLIDIQKNILTQIKHGETGDEIRMYIESECTKKNLFPIENCISSQQEHGYLTKDDSKYMILNYKKYFNSNDELISKLNMNYEFEEYDVYTINLSVAEESNEIIYKKHKSVIYNLNEFTYLLKLKSSRDYYNKKKQLHANYAFNINEDNSIKSRIGISEMIKNGILEEFPVLSINKDVITKKFTIIVGKDKSKLLKY